MFERLRVWTRAVARRGDVEREMRDEMRAHVERAAERLMARGLSASEARALAAREFGNVGVLEEAARDARGVRWVDELQQDVRYAARSLRRDPLLAVFVTLTLGLGIGANAAMFGVVDRLLLRGPEHVRDAARLRRLYTTARNRGGEQQTDAAFGYVTYALLSNGARSLDGVAAYQMGDGTLGRGAQAQSVTIARATASFFPLLGVRPLVGRFFTPEEDAVAGARQVAVIGYELWQREFGGRNVAIGSTILLNDESYTIVGIAPRGFTGVTLSRVDAWVPLSLMGRGMGPDWATAWYWTSIRVVARLGADVTPDQAGQAATALVHAAYPGNDPMIRNARLTFRPVSYDEGGREPAELSIARWLVAVTVIVLLIACANVINLLLARSFRRQREISVRVALGAGRARLVRLLLTEGILLSGAGAVAGLVVAYVLGGVIRGVLLPNVEWTRSPVDGRVLVLLAAVALGVGIVIGLVPALRASRPDLSDALRTTVNAGGARLSRVRSVLTLAQASLSVVLLVGAGLFIRSVRNVNELNLGVAADRVLAVRLLPSRVAGESPEAAKARRRAFWFGVLDRARALPGVEHASLSIGLPFGSYYGVGLWIPGRDSLPALQGGNPRIHAVADDYFATTGTRILRGRGFTPADQGGAERVVIVSDRLARAYWPSEDALGKCLIVLKKHDPCFQVIGISENTYTRDVSEEPGLQFYVPFDQVSFGGMVNLVVRPTGDPAPMVGPLRRALLSVDSTLGYLNVQTLREGLDPQLRPWRLGTAIFGLFGVLAALIAAAGLYSVVAYAVTTRVHEIGVRSALGATRGDIVRMIVLNAFGLAALGTVVGLIAACVAGRFIEPLLFRTSAADPLVFALVAAILLGTALAAAMFPALRAGRVSAVEALRHE